MIVYEDGTKLHPEYHDLGYSFLDASKVLVIVFENKQFYIYSAVDFGLLDIPVKVQGVYEASIFGSEKLIGYKFYLMNDAPIASLYNYNMGSRYETTLPSVFSNSCILREQKNLIIYDNSLSKPKEWIRKNMYLSETPPPRENVQLVNFDEIVEFSKQNDSALNSLYTSYEETFREIDTGNLISNQKTLIRGNGITTHYHK